MAKNKVATESQTETQDQDELDSLSETDQPSEPDLINDAFTEAMDAQKEEDDVKMAMITAGATFKNVTRLFNQYMVTAGLALSKDDRDKIVDDTLEGLDFETEEQFKRASDDLEAAITGATSKQAAALVRAYAKKNELECYVKPKGEGVARVSFASKYYDFLKANPTMDEATAKSYIMGEGEYGDTSENVQKNLKHYLGIFALVKSVADSYQTASVAA